MNSTATATRTTVRILTSQTLRRPTVGLSQFMTITTVFELLAGSKMSDRAVTGMWATYSDS